MAWLGFPFYNRSYLLWRCATIKDLVIQTHGRVSPAWDLKDALPTELQRRGVEVMLIKVVLSSRRLFLLKIVTTYASKT